MKREGVEREVPLWDAEDDDPGNDDQISFFLSPSSFLSFFFHREREGKKDPRNEKGSKEEES